MQNVDFPAWQVTCEVFLKCEYDGVGLVSYVN
jgi:hypothetical protein